MTAEFISVEEVELERESGKACSWYYVLLGRCFMLPHEFPFVATIVLFVRF